MFGRRRRPGARTTNITLVASAESAGHLEPVDPGREAAELEALASELHRLGAGAPAIDQRRVWLRVQAAMRLEPQRRSRVPRVAPLGSLLSAAPRVAVAGALAVALLLGALLGSLLLQSQ